MENEKKEEQKEEQNQEKEESLDIEKEKQQLEEDMQSFEKELSVLLNETEEQKENGKEEEVKKEEVKEKEVKEKEKKGDLSKAVKEKNRKIQELKQKIADYEAKLNKFTENPSGEGENQKSVTESVNSEEVAKAVEAINNTCSDLEQRYKDSAFPFRKGEVLLYLYKKTGGYVEDLSLIEDAYLALAKRNEVENLKLEEKRKNARTETPSGMSSGSNYEPKNLDEAFEIIKRR